MTIRLVMNLTGQLNDTGYLLGLQRRWLALGGSLHFEDIRLDPGRNGANVNALVLMWGVPLRRDSHGNLITLYRLKLSGIGGWATLRRLSKF